MFKRKYSSRYGTRKYGTRKYGTRKYGTRKYGTIKKKSGLPHTTVRTLGRYSDPIAQQRLAPRKAHIQLCQRYSCVDTVPQAAGVGVITVQFFCNNNISGTSFVAPGDNIDGLSALMKVQASANGPRGLNNILFDRFIYAMVLASAIRVRVERTDGPSNVTDGEFYVALTPLSSLDANQVCAGVPTTHMVYGTNTWIGATPQQKWDSVLDMPGTRYGRIGNWNGGLSQKVILKMKHNQSYFNPEPEWIGSSGTNLWCTRTTPGVLPGTSFWNYYALTYYSPQGIAGAVAIPVNVNVDQRWYCRGFDPVAAAILT